MRGLVRRHDQVILWRDVIATVARPSDVERLALDRAARHFDQLADHAHLHRVAQQRVVDYRTVDQGQRKVSHIDGKPYALGKVQAGLTAAQLGLIGDVIVNECRRVEMLNSRRSARGELHVPANRAACREADERTVALAAVFAIALQGIVEIAIHIGMRARRNVGVEDVPNFGRVTAQVRLERGGRLLGQCDDVVDGFHAVGKSPVFINRTFPETKSGRGGGTRTHKPCGGGF